MAYTGAKTTRFFSGTIGKPGAAPDLSWTEYHCRAGNALNDVKASVLFKGSTGNARDGSRTVTLYDLVTNQNPNDNGKPFPEEHTPAPPVVRWCGTTGAPAVHHRRAVRQTMYRKLRI